MSIRDQNKIRSSVLSKSYRTGILRITGPATSSTVLDEGDTYVSNWADGLDYNSIRGFVFTSGSIGDSGNFGGVLSIEQSSDGITSHYTGSQISASNNQAEVFDETLYSRYVRLLFYNNASGSGNFIVDSYLVP